MWLMFALLACQPSPSRAVAPPPPALELSTLVAGGYAEVAVETGLGAGERVWVIGGPGGVVAGPCAPALGGLCVAIARPRVIGAAVTDATGRARLRFGMPDLPGLRVTIQVVRPDPVAPWVSAPATGTLLAGDGDEDQDGLTNLAELAARSDVFTADSDGGGTLDGQEVLVDRTDPRVGADDMPGERRCGGDGVDDDGDGLTDCGDADCALRCPEARCEDGVDDDGDGRVDCADTDCPACAEDCGNGVDDDRDGRVDRRDPDCGERCDGLDADGDRLVDCADPDFACAETCGNGADEDGDLLADCADPDCACVEQCTNLVDDDRDGLADCADPECGVACGERCDNGVDDDGDGLVDCEDGGCVDLCAEDCSNGVDDNGDAWVDCQDDACWEHAACPPPSRVAWVEGGALRTSRSVGVARGSSCGANGEMTVTAVSASDVLGRVWVDHAGRTDSCAWRVDHAAFGTRQGWVESEDVTTYQTTYGSTWTWVSCRQRQVDVRSARRDGLRVEPGCGVVGSDFLPDRVVAGVAPFVGRTAAGAPWYAGLSSGTSTAYVGGGGGGPGDRTSFVAGFADRLQPAGPYGVCAVGTPSFYADPAALWGVVGVCAP